MYTLLHNSQIKVGPRQYAYSFFQDYLDKNSIDFTLPFDYDGSETIIVNDDIKVVKVEEPTIPTHNTLIEQLAGPYFNTSVEPITGYYDIAPKEITSIKNELIALAAAKRYEKEMAGFTMSLQGNDVSISTTKEERAIWHQIFSVIGENTIKFKFSTVLWLDLNLSEVQSVIAAIVNHVQNCFIWESNIIAQIELATDTNTLLAINDTIIGVV